MKIMHVDLESIQVLWGHKAPMTSNQILDEIKDNRKWKLASLMTTLARTADKGISL